VRSPPVPDAAVYRASTLPQWSGADGDGERFVGLLSYRHL
jgi:hypothetical protein